MQNLDCIWWTFISCAVFTGGKFRMFNNTSIVRNIFLCSFSLSETSRELTVIAADVVIHRLLDNNQHYFNMSWVDNFPSTPYIYSRRWTLYKVPSVYHCNAWKQVTVHSKWIQVMRCIAYSSPSVSCNYLSLHSFLYRMDQPQTTCLPAVASSRLVLLSGCCFIRLYTDLPTICVFVHARASFSFLTSRRCNMCSVVDEWIC